MDYRIENDLLSWLKSRAMDGYNALKDDPVWAVISRNQDYVDGRQSINRKEGRSIIVDNRVKKSLFTIAANLTDVRPIWDYSTNNSNFKAQSEILNKLARGWWQDTMADFALQDAIKFAGVGGSGYAWITWNPELPGGGNLELIPLDPRDVIPIGHPSYGGSLQDWKGVVIRQRRSVSWLKERYPHKSYTLNPSGSWFMDDVRRRPSNQRAYAKVWDVLKKGLVDSTSSEDGVTDFMRIFIKDSSVWRGEGPIQMGRDNWAYTVLPVGFKKPDGSEVSEDEARLYPGGRLIVCTPNAILDDIPNPYWHGMFPVVKVSLDPTPWSLLGSSVVSELVGLQDDLNSALRGLSDNIKQHIKRGLVADKFAIPDAQLFERMDTSDPGWKLRINPTMGEGVKVIDPAVLPSYYMEYINYLKTEIDDVAGTKDLEQLAALKQLPSADTVQQFMEAMTPLLKLRARVMEKSLGEVAEIMKVNFFQFYDVKRRIRLLGRDGITQEDILDYDPDQMIPSLGKGDPGYNPSLDKDLSRMERAKEHHKNFNFHITPNSFLNVTHTQKKMMGLQLYRMGALDIWSLWNLMDIPGTGPEPATTIPERLKAQMKAALGLPPDAAAQIGLQMAMQGGMGGPGGPEGGAPPPPGGGGGGGPVGRPPTAQEPPKLEERMGPDGPRQIVSESG